MRKICSIITILFSCNVLSSYYDINEKYTPIDNSCLPKSQMNVEFKQEKIENYINMNKKPLRKKPKYEEIN